MGDLDIGFDFCTTDAQNKVMTDSLRRIDAIRLLCKLVFTPTTAPLKADAHVW